ncbi:putative N-acetyl-gamma-glutamyl-phosphate reductase, chloroplastic-like [Dorcoceras hygrometricum]|uniref:Putative N-acetyl-gamma-glutamyl-phosphate reductase, chloroplastic-like n=1 Tax=Dorcoceras hygrometricum TaxID=472368 RepID=A0A2Z7C7P0_9LAMI|nr:putative N-acetyl-gamma-glutamyl-phosphate reductase, chloroplastic-like [Dorcoceras hygrometricum]
MGSLSSLYSIYGDQCRFVKYKVGKLCVRASVSTAAPRTSEFEEIKATKSEKFRIGVLGASGYTGCEIIRLLSNHPNFQITLMTADRKAGQSIGSVFPHLVKQELPTLVAKDADCSNLDAVFCCLPHGTTQVDLFLLLYPITAHENLTQFLLSLSSLSFPSCFVIDL